MRWRSSCIQAKVIGIDIWDKLDIARASPERAYHNAVLEGVADQVEFRTGNALDLPFPDRAFDVVIAAGLLNSMLRNEQRRKALAEIRRVLCYGGKFLLIEPLRTPLLFLLMPLLAWKFLPKRYYIALLEQASFRIVRYRFQNEMGFFLTKKRRVNKAS